MEWQVHRRAPVLNQRCISTPLIQPASFVGCLKVKTII
uniref:Uncharacterized protein n=1 Tax=Anguilla anguilla TaxID=7936 RepID=A0A0E9PZL4_ANGAN